MSQLLTAYYNENDPYAAQWLRNLIAAGLIAPGDVDERSIVDVRAEDLRGYVQCHFFAGIGGWSRALRVADWSDNRSVWTGSCPCQPFSASGKRKGSADDRHLWPHWFKLVRECGPSIIFGEQVDRAIGKTWLDAVAYDLEQQGYAFGAAVLPACAVSAPHIRNRIWFVAHAGSEQHEGHCPAHKWPWTAELLAPNTNCADLREQPWRSFGPNRTDPTIARHNSPTRSMANANSSRRQAGDRNLSASRYNANSTGLAIRQGLSSNTRAEQPAAERANWWAVEPDVGRVAHGVSDRVDKLRAYGNAIVPQVAAEFIAAYRECQP